MPDHDVPVLIVGGSLVGMSAALSLGHHGVGPLVVEHHRGTAIHPRAAQVTQRTMEIYREVGIEAVIRQRSDEQFVQDGAIMAVETLAGRELTYFIANLNEGIRDVSPCERVFISQSLLEPLLRNRAEELGATLRFGVDMVSFDQDREGVTATLRDRDSGREQTVRAAYMIAADGAHSPVRERLAIPTSGHGVFSNSVTIYFRADVANLLRGRNLSVIYVNHPRLRGFFRFEKPFERGFLAINSLGPPDAPITDVASGLTEQRSIDLIRLALGSEDIPVSIENVMTWNASADVASRLREGRVFLAGDAAHVMPPNGGFGGNTGVQDAHNLAWKLAYVLKGLAAPDLLSTYGPERQPVGALTTEQAYSRYVTRTAPYLGTDGIQPVVGDLNVELGYLYRSEAICAEGGEPDAGHEDPRASRGRPGSRAPHVWLDDRRSTLDLYGRGFVLLAGPDGQAWRNASRIAGRALGLDVEAFQFGSGPFTAAGEELCRAHGIAPTGALLVRPDGFIGWRAGRGEQDAAGLVPVVARALASMTGGRTVPS